MPPSHDWSHVQRVYNKAIDIARIEGGDLVIIRLAAFLHDIGRKKESENPSILDHAEISAEYASKILDKYGINPDLKKQIVHCILSHRFRKDRKPATIEARVLFDADKLDCIGAIGVARAYAFVGENKTKLYSNRNFLGNGYDKEHSALTEFLFKLSKVRDNMQTNTGRLMASNRHNYISGFFEQLNKELTGEL